MRAHGQASLVAAIAVALASATAGAQAVSSSLHDRQRPDVQAALAGVAAQTRAQLSTRPAPRFGIGRRRLSTSANVIGGAVLGASLGYFVSQVFMSDWEGSRAADRLPYRRRFAFSGAVVGAVGGYLLRPRGRARRSPETYVYIARTERHYIVAGELRRAVVLNALEAVRQLRPEWLRRGAEGETTGGQGGGASPSSADTLEIAVYVVDTRVGGPKALEEIAIPEVEELRLYEPEDAERRWGGAHPLGAIEVVPATRGGR